jgi:hypothetical protein
MGQRLLLMDCLQKSISVDNPHFWVMDDEKSLDKSNITLYLKGLLKLEMAQVF